MKDMSGYIDILILMSAADNAAKDTKLQRKSIVQIGTLKFSILVDR